MARQVKLFLIRHGETVDNVAQVYAGSRDSELTNHGVHQATRLGQHFNSLGLRFTHFFSSHLQRAVKTANLIRQAQDTGDLDNAHCVPEVVQVRDLMEQDFGFYEGKKFHERPSDSKLTGKESHRQRHKDEPGFVDVESKESMVRRADDFLDEYLLPIFEDASHPSDIAIAIVSHGIMLSRLWKSLLSRLPPKSLSLAPSLILKAPHFSPEHLGGWTNTGYLELYMSKAASQGQRSAPRLLSSLAPTQTDRISSHSESYGESSKAVQATRVPPPVDGETCHESAEKSESSTEVFTQKRSSDVLNGWTTFVQVVNSKDHLNGLKRTRGGIGSAKHDNSQQNIESFFKRRKLT